VSAEPEKTEDHVNELVIMVLKNSSATDLTVGRLNTTRAFTRTYSDGKPGVMSREITVLPCSSKSGPYSAKGDLGSVVVDSKSRVCGLLTCGDGDTHVADCTYLTSINFIIKRLEHYGVRANIFPKPVDI